MVKSLFPSFSKLASKNKVKAKALPKFKEKDKPKAKLASPQSSSASKKPASSPHSLHEKSKSQSRSSQPSSVAAHAAPQANKAKQKVALNLNKKGEISVKRSLLDTLGDTVCREVACEGLATSGGYCRLHYIKNWKKIKRKEVILRERKLNQYIEELVVKYPDKYIEAIRQDLASDKDFAKVIYDLDLDETVDEFDVDSSESVDSLIDTIKRDFEDDGDAF